MNKLTTLLSTFIEDESGLTAVEYAVAGSLVVGGLVTAFTQLGNVTESTINDLCEAAGGDGMTTDANTGETSGDCGTAG